MNEFDDPLDLLGDDGDGVVEMCLLEEEGKLKNRSENKSSGCCVVLLLLVSSMVLAGWCVSQLV